GALDELTALGARQLAAFPRWTVLADPEGQEFCAFVRESPPDYRLYEVVIDSPDPAAIGRWWAQVFGAELEPDEDWDGVGVRAVPGMPFEYLVFGPVPEPKTVKNRLHWDVEADPDALVAAGATLLRPKGGDIRWHVLADPDGNEFCVFD
ncbi:MAG TPA: VOC family protein, partial [Jatrophihabitans sp.]|nr:VOC family protein [Jatrophihabitans sp.]